MLNLKASLKRIVGRIIKVMKEYLLAWGGIYLPSGLVCMLLAFDKEGFQSIGFMGVGIFLVIGGLLVMGQAIKQSEKQEKKDDCRFKQLINEIRALRSDKNDYTNPDKQ